MLTVYRRHKRECKAGHPHELRTSEFDERKKGWKRCECPIFASGTLGRDSRRQSTGKWQWESAKALASVWEATGSWITKSSPPPALGEPGISRITLKDAVRVYLAYREGSQLASPTLRKYKTFTKHLTEFADNRGY